MNKHDELVDNVKAKTMLQDAQAVMNGAHTQSIFAVGVFSGMDKQQAEQARSLYFEIERHYLETMKAIERAKLFAQELVTKSMQEADQLFTEYGTESEVEE